MDTQTNTTSTDTEPKTKESSVLDFTYLSLTELESQVVSLFPNEEYPEGEFHLELLAAVTSRLIMNGYPKEELLELFTFHMDEAANLLKEIEKEEAA